MIATASITVAAFFADITVAVLLLLERLLPLMPAASTTSTTVMTTTPEVQIATVARSPPKNRLVGLVVKASASRAEDPGFESRLRRDFFGVESYQ